MYDNSYYWGLPRIWICLIFIIIQKYKCCKNVNLKLHQDDFSSSDFLLTTLYIWSSPLNTICEGDKIWSRIHRVLNFFIWKTYLVLLQKLKWQFDFTEIYFSVDINSKYEKNPRHVSKDRWTIYMFFLTKCISKQFKLLLDCENGWTLCTPLTIHLFTNFLAFNHFCFYFMNSVLIRCKLLKSLLLKWKKDWFKFLLRNLSFNIWLKK